MVHRCCISSCGMNVRVAEAKGLSYHTFPLKEPQRYKWIAAVLPYIDKPTTFKVVQGYTRICSRHFSKKDYSIDSKKRARLSSSAVPSIFPEKGSPVIIENVLENVRTGSNDTSSSLDDRDPHTTTKPSKDTTDQCVNISIKNDAENNPSNVILQTKDDLTLTSKKESRETKEGTTKKRKVRKHRSMAPKSVREVKRRSSVNTSSSYDELNIEGVGEALAEIKLSKLLGIAPSEIQPNFAIPKEWKVDLAPVKAGATFRNQQIGSLVGSVESLCSSTDDHNLTTPGGSSAPLACITTTSTVEPELLLSIESVNISSKEQDALNAPTQVKPEQSTSESEPDVLPLFHDFEESLLSTLRLDDMHPLSSFDNLERFNDTKLAYDLSSSLFQDSGNISSSLLDMNEIHLPGLDSSLQSPFDFDFNSEDILISEFQNMSANSDNTAELTPVKKLHMVQQHQIKLEHDDTTRPCLNLVKTELFHDVDKTECSVPTSWDNVRQDGRLTPDPTENKKRKTCSGFSVDRFCDSDKDIEYYTGFTSYSKFEAFFRDVQRFALKLKEKDHQERMAKSLTDPQQDRINSSECVTNPYNVIEPPNSSDGSLTLIDELFLTIVRLKRKLPEKVLGHMFFISRLTASHTIRSWTILLSKLVEVSGSKNIQENSDVDKTTEVHMDNSSTSNGIEIPQAVRHLLNSELAKTIISSAGSKSLSRKTSCTTNCLNASKSKRPKKEKTSLVVGDNLIQPSADKASVGQTSIKSEKISISDQPTLTSVSTEVNDSREAAPEIDVNSVSDVVELCSNSEVEVAIESQLPLVLLEQEQDSLQI